MNKHQLFVLARAAEVALPYVSEHEKQEVQLALDAVYQKLAKAKKPYRRHSRTATRAQIRADLLVLYHKVRLNQLGEWHVQASPGSCWLIYALNDSDAQEQIDEARAQRPCSSADLAQV